MGCTLNKKIWKEKKKGKVEEIANDKEMDISKGANKALILQEKEEYKRMKSL